MNPIIAVIAGSLGALARYAVTGWVQGRARTFPSGTAVVNLAGCLGLGVAAASLDAGSTALAGVAGLLGGFTTFSTWAVETVALLGAGPNRRAWLNLVLNVAGGIAMAAIGYSLGS